MKKHLFRCLSAMVTGVALTTLGTALPAAAGGALPTVPPVTVTDVQPGTPSAAYVKRVAAPEAGAAQTWRLNVGAWIRNDGGQSLTLTEVEIAYTGGSQPSSKTVDVSDDGITIPPGSTERVIVPEDRQLAFPVPSYVTLRFTFAGYSSAKQHTRALLEYANSTRLGSYYFPARASDLGTDEYWANATHKNSSTQIEAFDLAVRKWDADTKVWRSVKPGTKGWSNSDHYIFGKPVYAMADGLVLWCNRTVDENVPMTNDNPDGTKGAGGGNDLFIEHANGEVALYAHLKDNTVPLSLCPQEATDISGLGIWVKTGQYLGDVGNTGQSEGPHLHVDIRSKRPHTVAGGSSISHGRPVRFHNIAVRAFDSSWNSVDPSGLSTSWATAQPGATPGHYVLIKPNPCGWDAPLPTAKEYARHYVPAACHQHVINEAVFAGHKPEWVDGFEVGTKTYFNSVHRPDGGAIWSARHGLTATQYQEAFDTFVPAGFRATLVESYLQEGKVRYAVIFVKDGAPQPVAYHGYSQAQHQAMANNLVDDGFRPVNVSVVSVGGNRSYTALFEKINVGSFQLTSTIPQADYQKWVDDNIEAGRRLVYVNAYAHAGSMWFAAIATSAASPNYQAVHGLTSAQYQQAWAQYAGSMPTRVVTGYAAGNQALFAAIWRK